MLEEESARPRKESRDTLLSAEVDGADETGGPHLLVLPAERSEFTRGRSGQKDGAYKGNLARTRRPHQPGQFLGGNSGKGVNAFCRSECF
jgi:hypothetical protein